MKVVYVFGVLLILAAALGGIFAVVDPWGAAIGVQPTGFIAVGVGGIGLVKIYEVSRAER